jgi:hypothetical protein
MLLSLIASYLYLLYNDANKFQFRGAIRITLRSMLMSRWRYASAREYGCL